MRLARALVRVGAVGAALATAHTAVNLRLLRVPPADPPPTAEPVSVLLPVRDEAGRVGPCVRAVLASTGVPDLEVLVLDDGCTDGTADVVRRVAGGDPRLRLLTGAPLPPGWLGKPHACAQLAAAASGGVFVFVDADVVLAPHAVAATVALLRAAGLDLVSPYPRQLAGTASERLVQPLLQWSWLTTLPLRLAERSPRPSLAAANGQLLAVDAATYARAGGHAAVRGEVLEDLALVRRVKAAAGRGGMADGTGLATCRMYTGWGELRDGYTKSLWSAFGSPAGAAGALGLLGVLYVVPPLAALRRSPTRLVGLAGYAAGVAGRALVARRVGGRVWPDALAHPVSVVLLAELTAQSWRRRRAGTLRWKDRPLDGDLPGPQPPTGQVQWRAADLDPRLAAAPVVVAFAEAVRSVAGVVGCYAGGSLATGDYVPAVSDLDLVAVVADPLDAGRRARLRQFHEAFRRDHPAAAKLHCVYVPRDAAADIDEPHVTWAHNELFDRPLSGIGRAELLRGGITVYGPPPATYLPALDRDALEAAAHTELAGYWTRAVRRPWRWHRDLYVDLGLLTVARAEAALSEGRLITKREALARLPRLGVPAYLVREIEQRRYGQPPALTRWQRARRALLARRLVARGIRDLRS